MDKTLSMVFGKRKDGLLHYMRFPNFCDAQ